LFDVGVLIGQSLLPHRKRPLVERLGLCESPLLAIDLRKIVDALCNLKVPEWQGFLAKFQRPMQELLRLAESAKVQAHKTQPCGGRSDLRIFRIRLALGNRQSAAVDRLCLRVPALIGVQAAEVVQVSQQVRIVRRRLRLEPR
jgi:hypothetical protein